MFAICNFQVKDPSFTSEVKIVFEPAHWMGKRFSPEDDVKLLTCLNKIGLLTPNVFEVLQTKLS